MSGHGGDGFLKFQDFEEVSSPDLADAFEEMHGKQRYNEILFIVDTCQASTLGEDVRVPNVLAVGSSLRGQNSYGHHTDHEVRDGWWWCLVLLLLLLLLLLLRRSLSLLHARWQVGVAVIDRFTYYALEFFETQGISRGQRSRASLQQLFNYLASSQLHSTPHARTDLFRRRMSAVPVSDFFGAVPRVVVSNHNHSQGAVVQPPTSAPPAGFPVGGESDQTPDDHDVWFGTSSPETVVPGIRMPSLAPQPSCHLVRRSTPMVDRPPSDDDAAEAPDGTTYDTVCEPLAMTQGSLGALGAAVCLLVAAAAMSIEVGMLRYILPRTPGWWLDFTKVSLANGGCDHVVVDCACCPAAAVASCATRSADCVRHVLPAHLQRRLKPHTVMAMTPSIAHRWVGVGADAVVVIHPPSNEADGADGAARVKSAGGSRAQPVAVTVLNGDGSEVRRWPAGVVERPPLTALCAAEFLLCRRCRECGHGSASWSARAAHRHDRYCWVGACVVRGVLATSVYSGRRPRRVW